MPVFLAFTPEKIRTDFYYKIFAFVKGVEHKPLPIWRVPDLC